MRARPFPRAEIEVCFVDDDGRNEWWSAIVVRLGNFRKKGTILCTGSLVYTEEHED